MLENKNIIWNGRYLDYQNIRYFGYSASGFTFVMKGKKAVAEFISDASSFESDRKAVIGVFIVEGNKPGLENISDEPDYKYTLEEKNNLLLFESDEEKTVTITVMKFNEAEYAYAGLKDLMIEGEIEKADISPLKLEFIGDSITCGYGVEGIWEKDLFTTQTERPDKAYAIQTCKILKAQAQLCSWSGIGITSHYVDPETVNLPETSWLMPPTWPYTDKGLSLRLGIEPEVWNQERFSPDIVVINLGTNDISWVRNVEERRLNFVAQYRQLLESVHRRSPNAKICCCIGAMGDLLNYSVQEAAELFNKEFKNVKIKTVFFPVQDEKDGIGTDWHPSPVTHKKMADKLSYEILRW